MDKNKELKVTGTSTVEETFEKLRNKNETYRLIFDSFEITNAMMKKLVELRKEAGLSQRDLAKLTNIKQPQIARYETCEESPRLDNFIRIVDALKYRLVFEKKNEIKDKSFTGKELSVNLSK